MMFTQLFWIGGPLKGRLAISARPRGGEWLADEMKAWHEMGVDAVVSLLESREVEELGLLRERECCEAAGMQFFSLPIVDRSVPASDADVARMLAHLERELDSGNNISIHCRQGVGRAGLIAAALLVENGTSPAEAVKQVSLARQVSIPETPEQRAWIDSFATTLNRKV